LGSVGERGDWYSRVKKRRKEEKNKRKREGKPQNERFIGEPGE